MSTSVSIPFPHRVIRVDVDFHDTGIGMVIRKSVPADVIGHEAEVYY